MVNILFVEEYNLNDLFRVRGYEGYQRGIELGMKQVKYRMAVSLMGIEEDEIITEKTGLTIDEVKELRKLMKL